LVGSYDIFGQLSKYVLFLFEFFFLKISYYEPYFGTIYVASYVVGVYITSFPSVVSGDMVPLGSLLTKSDAIFMELSSLSLA